MLTFFGIGKKIAVYANYFKVTAQPQLQLTRYNVEVSPEAKGKKLARIFQLLREYASQVLYAGFLLTFASGFLTLNEWQLNGNP